MKSADVFSELVRKYPRSEFAAEAQYRVGECLFNKGEYEESIKAFDGVLRDFSASEYVDDALYSKAWSLIRMRREAEAIPIFRKIVEKFGGGDYGASSQFSLGDYFYSVKDYENAASEYERFVELYPDHKLVPRAKKLLENLAEINAYNLYRKGEDLFDKGKYDESIEVFRDVIDRFPESNSAVSALCNIAAAYEAKEDFDRAKSTYTELIERFSDDPRYSAQIEFARVHLKNIESAF